MQQFPPSLWEAIRRGDRAAVLRHARLDAGLSQGDLGERFGCSASAISRFENGQRPMRDIEVLRRFAGILNLPPEAFGLNPTRPDRGASQHTVHSPSKVNVVPQREEDDPVRRRAFLMAAGLASSTLATSRFTADAAEAGPDPAAVLTRRIEAVLVSTGPINTAPVPVTSLRAALSAANSDFRAARYVPLAARLPEIVTAAEATCADSDDTAEVVLAQAYNLVTRALIKLHASGLEWISADRAFRAAAQAGDPLTLAEAQRMMGSVCRRAGHHDRAHSLTLGAADHLDLSGQIPDPEHLSLHGILMCSAGYAAARAGDRDRAGDLLGEAAATADRLAGHPARQQALAANVSSHRVSAAYVLGDAGSALQYARAARLGSFPDTERQGRFLVDVALAYAQWDKPEQAYRTLLEAEHHAPGEVRTRSAVRGLVTDLMQHRNHAALPGLRDLAIRTHAVA